MTHAAPALVSSLSNLGRPVQVGGWELFVRRLTPAGLFRLTFLENNDENSQGEFFVRDGQVLLMYVSAGLVRVFGSRDALRAALQAAYKPARPVSPSLAALEATRAAYKAHRTLANVRAFNAAWNAHHAAVAARKAAR